MFNYSMADRATKATIDCALKATMTLAAETPNVVTGIYQDVIYIWCPECSLLPYWRAWGTRSVMAHPLGPRPSVALVACGYFDMCIFPIGTYISILLFLAT